MEFGEFMSQVVQEIQGKGFGYISDIYLMPDRAPYFFVCKKWLFPQGKFLPNLQGFRVTREFIRNVLATCYERNTEKGDAGFSPTSRADRIQTDFAFDWEAMITGKKISWRIRAHVSYNNQGQSLALRMLTREIPSLEDLHIPRYVRDFANHPSGLLLICGPTGGGKSTTMASIVKSYAMNRFGHIATLEDPIEYVFDFPERLITQQAVGRHVDSWSNGIYHALRDKVELLMIGEMRDQDSIRAAIQAASTGHLVLAATHYTSATHVLNALVNVFPQHEVESMKQALVTCLIGVVCQDLVPATVKGQGAVLPCYEILFNTPDIKANLIKNSFNVITSLLGSSKAREQGNVLWKHRLDELFSGDYISRDVYDFYQDMDGEMKS
jgi:pilus retraction protein PilT